MTELDRIYTTACAMPPSPERTAILESLVRLDRWEKLVRKGKFHDPFSTCHMLICEAHKHV